MNPRRVTIILDIDPEREAPSRRQVERYSQLAKPLRLVQVVGNRVRVERGGTWSHRLFACREELAAALLFAAADARGKAEQRGPDTATGAYYTTTANFLQDSAIAVLQDDRIGDMWSIS